VTSSTFPPVMCGALDVSPLPLRVPCFRCFAAGFRYPLSPELCEQSLLPQAALTAALLLMRRSSVKIRSSIPSLFFF